MLHPGSKRQNSAECRKLKTMLVVPPVTLAKAHPGHHTTISDKFSFIATSLSDRSEVNRSQIEVSKNLLKF